MIEPSDRELETIFELGTRSIKGITIKLKKFQKKKKKRKN